MSLGPTVPRVHVRDLGNYGDKEELRHVFSKFGRLDNVWIANNPPGFAYIFYQTFEDAERAVGAMNGKKVCGVRVRVELSPIEDRRRSVRGRGGGGSGGGYDSKDKDYQSNRGRGRYDDNSRYGGGGGGSGGRNDYNNYSDNRGRNRGRGSGNYNDHGYGGRNRGSGRDNGDNYGGRGGRSGSYVSGGGGGYGFSGRGNRGSGGGGGGGGGGGYRDHHNNHDRGGDRGSGRDNYYDDYQSKGRGRGRSNYGSSGRKRDSYGEGSRGYDVHDDRHVTSGSDVEYRSSRKDDYMRKREGSGSGSYFYNKGSEDYHRSSSYNPKEQLNTKWASDYENEDYRDRSPHQKLKTHRSSYQKQQKVSRARSRSSKSHTSVSSTRSLSPLPPLKPSSQKRRKARGSDYGSSSRSPPPTSSRYSGSYANIPSAYRHSYEPVENFRSETSFDPRQYPSDNRRVEYETSERTILRRSRDKNGKTSSRGDIDYENEGSRYLVKERRGGGYMGRGYDSHSSDIGSASPSPVISHGSHYRSSQKRKRLVNN